MVNDQEVLKNQMDIEEVSFFCIILYLLSLQTEAHLDYVNSEIYVVETLIKEIVDSVCGDISKQSQKVCKFKNNFLFIMSLDKCSKSLLAFKKKFIGILKDV